MRKKCIKINRIKMHKYIYNFDGPFILWSKIPLLKKSIFRQKKSTFDKKSSFDKKSTFDKKFSFDKKSIFDKKPLLTKSTFDKKYTFDEKIHFWRQNPLLTKKSTFDEKLRFWKKGLFVIGDFFTFKLISLTSNDLGNDSVLLKRTIIFKYGF